MKMGWLTGVCLVAIVATAGVACGDDDDTADDTGAPEELRDITLMLDFTPNTNHSGIYLALERGWYEEEGLNVTIVEPASAGVELIVGQGEADFGISYQEFQVPARAAGVPVVSIAAILQHNDSSFMSLAEDGIEDAADLAGKTYGGFGGPLEMALIERLVECEGEDPESITFLEAGAGDPVVAMEEDRFDYAWVFEGWDVIRAREVLGKDVNTVRFRDYFDCIPDWYTPIVITSESMIDEEPDVVRSFMAATARGYDAAIEEPDAAADALLAAVPELDEELVRLSAAHLADVYVDEGTDWGTQEEEIWVEFEAFLREAGLLEAEVDVSEAYTNDFLPD